MHIVEVYVGTGGNHQNGFLRRNRPKDILRNSIVTPSLLASFSPIRRKVRRSTHYISIVEMAKAYDLDLCEYLNLRFEQRPNKGMSDEELENWLHGMKV